MRKLPLILASAALLGVVVLFYRVSRIGPVSPQPVAVEEDHYGTEDLEVAVIMGRIQRYHQKLWLAGKEGNTELARFYLHEIDEAMKEISEGGVVDEGVNVSDQMEIYGLPIINKLTEVLDSNGVVAMHGRAGELVGACNACHASTDHGYIRIQVPSAVNFPDQDFAPAK